MEINVHEAKTHLSRLLKRVSAGEEVTISRAGIPVAKLIAVSPSMGVRPLGAMEGQIRIGDDFDAPLPDDVLASFYGGDAKRREPTRARTSMPKKKRTRP
jgi:prevent-host-death family protein